MEPGSTAPQVGAVADALVADGLAPFVSRGVERTVVGAVGDVDAALAADGGARLETLAGVERVVRLTSPYKLVASHADHHRSTVRSGSAEFGPRTFTFI